MVAVAEIGIRPSREIGGMSNRLAPPDVGFDPTLANEFPSFPPPAPAAADELYPIHGRRTPFKDYVRMDH
jgi:hypothetical protein